MLALLLSSQGKFKKALELTIQGCKACLSVFKPAFETFADAELSINWIIVEGSFKREYLKYFIYFNLSLKFTQLALENKVYGTIESLSSLPRLFKIFKRIIGVIESDEKSFSRKCPPLIGKKASNFSIGNLCNLILISALGHSLNTDKTSPNVILINQDDIAIENNAYAYEAQINLWLSASALYREGCKFENAKASVTEAQSLLDVYSAKQHQIREIRNHAFFRASIQVNISEAMSFSVETNGNNWLLSAKFIRKIMADIALEAFLY